MALVILSIGTLASLAVSMAVRNLGLKSGFGSVRAAACIAFSSFEKAHPVFYQ